MKRGRDQINKDVGIKFKVHWEATGVTYDLGFLKLPLGLCGKKDHEEQKQNWETS